MVPKPCEPRLFTIMQCMDMNWQTPEPMAVVPFEVEKEPKLKLSLETRNRGDVVVVHCQGRIIYRDEAVALSRVVGDVMQYATKVVLDLSGVSSMDSAGIGELALLQTLAQEKNVSLKYAEPTVFVRNLLDLTNLDRVIDLHPSIESALEALREDEVCADC
jgi:anti-sigma B factor antagonist